jgi:hypothetical protein
VRGRDFCGYCAAKREQFFGWRLHLVCTPMGVPVAFDLLPGGRHDLTPIHELTYGLPTGAAVYADKAYNAGADEATILADTGVRLVPIRKANMRPNRWADKLALRAYRKRIETLYSQLAAMGDPAVARPDEQRRRTQAPRRTADQYNLAIRVCLSEKPPMKSANAGHRLLDPTMNATAGTRPGTRV